MPDGPAASAPRSRRSPVSAARARSLSYRSHRRVDRRRRARPWRPRRERTTTELPTPAVPRAAVDAGARFAPAAAPPGAATRRDRPARAHDTALPAVRSLPSLEKKRRHLDVLVSRHPAGAKALERCAVYPGRRRQPRRRRWRLVHATGSDAGHSQVALSPREVASRGFTTKKLGGPMIDSNNSTIIKLKPSHASEDVTSMLLEGE